ncbi:tetratricopeptide repeat protein [Mesorhizobium sp. PAMC28654]|nr:tetratricopeptide repeat protein [Mesorhizobium sp. PAMC28654]
MAYLNRGLAWIIKGDDEHAIAEFERVIELDPTSAAAYTGRGSALYEKGEYDRAIADYDKAIALNPKHAQAYEDRGIARFFPGPSEQAQADLAKAASLVPDNAYFAIWLDLAERHNGSAGHLRETTAKLDMTKWPAPVIRMLLGETTPVETLAAADDPNPSKKRDNLCEVNFYTAELNRLQGHGDAALPLYRLAVSDCPKNFVEYRGANAALRMSAKSP